MWKSVLTHKIVLIAALGYFVDLFDLVLYGVVRRQSLLDLGVTESDLFAIGSSLLNFQMGGMLAGGLFWGILGDKIGRRTALFGSILIYSLATFLNAFVETVPQYAALRMIAGFGLAGELGVAITLVTETLPIQHRGLGAALIAAIGFMGAATSSIVAQNLVWTHAYLLGGGLGLCLLFARTQVPESLIYQASRSKNLGWGSIRLLLFSKSRSIRLFLCLLAGIPIWYVAGVLGYFAPELAKSLEIKGEVTAGNAIMLGYLGAIIGDIACGILSYRLKSRKKAVFVFCAFGGTIALLHPLFLRGANAEWFLFSRFLIGFANGYVALLVAWVAELFGLNLRATATTLIPNLVRASVIPLTWGMRVLEPSQNLVGASITVGIISYVPAILAILFLTETYHRQMDWAES